VLETGGLLSVFSLSAFAGGFSLFGLADVSASDLGLTVGTNAIYQFHSSQASEDKQLTSPGLSTTNDTLHHVIRDPKSLLSEF